MATVVSDTSCLRALGHLGLLDLLRDLFAEVLVPPAVESELANPPLGSVSVIIGAYPFLKLQPPSDRQRVKQLRTVLDPGESEVVALALEVGANLVLIDETAGRAAVQSHGLVPLGVLGILSRAKHRGMIGPIKPLLDRLQNELRFFISARLRADVLRASGESP